MKIPRVQVVTTRSHAIRLWAIRIVSVALLVSLLAHIPAPRQLNLYIADMVPEVRQTVSEYRHRTELMELVAAAETARANRYESHYQATAALLQSCRNRLAIQSDDYDMKVIAMAIRASEYYNRPVGEVAGVIHE